LTTTEVTGDGTTKDGAGRDNTTFVDPLSDETGLDVEEEFLPRAKQRLGPLTLSLFALLIASLGFLGGIVVQKHSSSSSPGRSNSNGSFNPANVAGGFGGRRTGQGGSTNDAPAQADGLGSTSTDAAPAVIGTVVSVNGATAVVKNIAGKQITVHLNDDTTISKAGTTADLQPGTTVTVSGSSATDGSVTATSVQTK